VRRWEIGRACRCLAAGIPPEPAAGQRQLKSSACSRQLRVFPPPCGYRHCGKTRDRRKVCGQSQGDVLVMSSVSLRLLLWPGDPEPGRSALDEKRGTSTKPAEPPLRSSARWATPAITLPRSAGEFSRLRGQEDIETEAASDENGEFLDLSSQRNSTSVIPAL
jgi:hypothetical protein